MIFKTKFGMKPIFCTLVLIFCRLSTFTSATSDIVGIDLVSKYNDVLHKLNVSDILLSGDQGQSLSGIFSVLDRLRDVPTCSVHAASRLFTTCSELKDNSDDSRSRVDAIKTLFAIRMAICETAEGGAEIPKSCRDAIPPVNTATSKKLIMETDLRVAQSGILSGCVGSLRKEHYYWTSYSNHKQDASAVCDAMHAGVEQQKIIMFYREVTDNLANVVQTIDKHRQLWDASLEDMDSHFNEIVFEHNQILDSMRSTYEEHTSQSLKIFQEVRGAASTINTTIANADDGLAGALSRLQAFGVEFNAVLPVLKSNLARVFADASTDVIEVTNSQKLELESAIQAIIDPLVGGSLPLVLQNLTDLLMTAEKSSISIASSQQEQLLVANELLTAMEAQKLHQSATLETVNDVHAKVKMMSSDMESIAAPVRLLGALFQAYEESELSVGLKDVAVFGVFSTSATLLLLIPGLRIWGLYLYLCYGFLLSLRACMHYIDFYAISKEAATALVGMKEYHMVIVAFVSMFALNTLCIRFRGKDQANSKGRMRKYRALETVAHGQHAFRSHDSRPMRQTRAGTAPPEL